MLPPLTLRALDTAPAPEPETPETPETGLVASSSSVERRSRSWSEELLLVMLSVLRRLPGVDVATEFADEKGLRAERRR